MILNNLYVLRVLCIVIGYLFGIFQTAFVYGKAHGIDIRKHGSGNSGTTNTLRVLGTRAGLIVFAGDCLKAILAVLVTWLLFGRSNPEMIVLFKLYTGAGVILGHNFPFYMKFKGGKGIAATAGMIIAFDPWFVLMGVILFFGAFLITHYVSLGSLLVYAGFPTMTIICGQCNFKNVVDFSIMTQAQKIESYIIVFLLAAMAYYKHRANIVRLVKGQESKVYLFKNKTKSAAQKLEEAREEEHQEEQK